MDLKTNKTRIKDDDSGNLVLSRRIPWEDVTEQFNHENAMGDIRLTEFCGAYRDGAAVMIATRRRPLPDDDKYANTLLRFTFGTDGLTAERLQLNDSDFFDAVEMLRWQKNPTK